MAIIPLKQTAYVYKLVPPSDDEWLDDWDEETYGEPIAYKVRATETLKIVSSSALQDSIRRTVDEQAVATLVLLFDKLPNIAYNDEIEYTNELGVKIRKKPLTINPIRMINGKPTLTEVTL